MMDYTYIEIGGNYDLIYLDKDDATLEWILEYSAGLTYDCGISTDYKSGLNYKLAVL